MASGVKFKVEDLVSAHSHIPKKYYKKVDKSTEGIWNT